MKWVLVFHLIHLLRVIPLLSLIQSIRQHIYIYVLSAQLSMIKSMTMASVLCMTSGIGDSTLRAFELPNPS